MASLTQWTWAWANTRRQWRTGKLDMLQSMGSQSEHHLATEKQQQTWKLHCGAPQPSTAPAGEGGMVSTQLPYPQAELYHQPKSRTADSWLFLISFLLSDLCFSEDRVTVKSWCHTPQQASQHRTSPSHTGIHLPRKIPHAHDTQGLQDD